MEGFPSGQREQTVNLSSMTSVVRIHHLPPKEPILIRVSVLFWCQVEWIRKPALRNVPVARFNRRGLPVGRQPLKYLMVVPAVKANPPPDGQARVWQCGYRTAPANPGRHTPNPKAKQALRFHHLTKPERPFIITDMRTAFTCRVRSFPVASLELEENAAAFLGGGYFLRFKIPKTTVASSIRSVSTSIVVMRVTPLFQGITSSFHISSFIIAYMVSYCQ